MKLAFPRSHVREIAFYTVLTIGGLLVDLGTSNLLVYLWNMSLILAGTIGLITGTITNYFLHLKITFKDQNLSPTWKGFGKYVQTCLIGALVRIGVLACLDVWTNLAPFIALFVATGLSFTVNYLLSRHYVFKSPS